LPTQSLTNNLYKEELIIITYVKKVSLFSFFLLVFLVNISYAKDYLKINQPDVISVLDNGKSFTMIRETKNIVDNFFDKRLARDWTKNDDSIKSKNLNKITDSINKIIYFNDLSQVNDSNLKKIIGNYFLDKNITKFTDHSVNTGVYLLYRNSQRMIKDGIIILYDGLFFTDYGTGEDYIIFTNKGKSSAFAPIKSATDYMNIVRTLE
jgi:hypothetical protein